jgi:hypothetical protein
MRILIVLAISLAGCVHGSQVQHVKSTQEPLTLFLVTNYPGLHDEFERAVARELSQGSERLFVLETSPEPLHLKATCALEASIYLDCDQQPAPDGYSIRIERAGKVVASWHRTNIGCSEWACVTGRAARDLVHQLSRIAATPSTTKRLTTND